MALTRRGIGVFNSLLFEDDATTTLVRPEHKGRCPELIEKRDELLLYRFYYKSKIQRRIYDDVLDALEAEFFISQTMIKKIIQSKSELVLQIKRQQPDVTALKKRWPHIVW